MDIFVLFQVNAEFHGGTLIVSDFFLSIKDTGWETIATGGVIWRKTGELQKTPPIDNHKQLTR